jgi:diamine N-acetyltransferase
MNDPTLQSGEIRLRAIEPSDVDFIHRMENDPEAWKAGDTLVPYSRFQVEQYVLNTRHDLYTERQLRLMIERVPRGKEKEILGAVDLYDFDPHNRRAGIGILILPDARQKGYAFTALDILIRYCFDVLRFHQLHCSVAAGNTASIRLFEKAGFVKCGVRADWLLSEGRWTDEWMFQLIRKENP